VRRGAGGIAALLVLWLVTAGLVAALQAELAQYYDSAKDVCRTGVTPAMTAAYERARRALERADDARRPGSSFAGLKTPEQMWLDCFQSPGDGKT
jgi:hypothetical protein